MIEVNSLKSQTPKRVRPVSIAPPGFEKNQNLQNLSSNHINTVNPLYTAEYFGGGNETDLLKRRLGLYDTQIKHPFEKARAIAGILAGDWSST